MNSRTLMLAGIAGMMMIAAPAAAQGKANAAPATGTPIANQWVCTFDKAQVQRSQIPARANAAAQAAQGRVFHTYSNTIRGFAVRASQQGVTAMIQRNPWIRKCEQDRVITLAPPAGKGPGGGGTSSGQSTPWGITRVGGAGNGVGKTAWIIDSGIDLDHPDLTVDVGRSRDFTGGRGPDDENGHGTHVAGTIAAKNNSIGVVGVAAGATVVAVRVLDRRGSGAYSGVIEGVDYAAGAAKAGDVANMSLGGPVYAPLDEAVVAAGASGLKMVLAAGNDGEDATGHSPARANGTNVYTISAIDQNDRLTSWSNYGSPVDYAEPGLGIESTWKGGGYNTISGTSMASPHAAGILLLGAIRSDGTASGDRDSKPDPIGVR